MQHEVGINTVLIWVSPGIEYLDTLNEKEFVDQ